MGKGATAEVSVRMLDLCSGWLIEQQQNELEEPADQFLQDNRCSLQVDEPSPGLPADC